MVCFFLVSLGGVFLGGWLVLLFFLVGFLFVWGILFVFIFYSLFVCLFSN